MTIYAQRVHNHRETEDGLKVVEPVVNGDVLVWSSQESAATGKSIQELVGPLLKKGRVKRMWFSNLR